MSTLTGGTVNPQPPINIFDQYSREPQSTGSSFLNNLAASTMQTGPNGYGAIQGVQGYPGQTSPDMNSTMLPQVNSNWQPWNAGTGYLANYLPTAGQPSQAAQSAQSNVAQYGGIGGYPTQLMHSMAQFGGTGGPGNQAMANMLQFGSPSAAGQGIADMAKTGTSGTWGNPLYAMATGGNSGAMQYLAPFMKAQPYSSRRGA